MVQRSWDLSNQSPKNRRKCDAVCNGDAVRPMPWWHLIAMGGDRRGALTLEDLDRVSRTTPVIANIRPSGKQ